MKLTPLMLRAASTAGPRSGSRVRWRLGFDIGGTFTDFVLHDATDSTIRLHKRLTTSLDPAEAALAGLEAVAAMAGIGLGDVGEIVHGTTLVTNALTERTGARIGLITTAGFRDTLELGTEQRYDVFGLFLDFPEPLASRELRLEVPERLDRDGRVVTPLDEDGVRAALVRLRKAGAEAVAVCFLHAYRNPRHEQRVAEIAREEFPGLPVSLSAEVAPEMGEYRRFVTTAANAYVQPLVDRYLNRLEAGLAARGFTGAFNLMHSAGGLMSARLARTQPVRLLESGAAGGAVAAARFADTVGYRDVIAFDMGGTTAKACLVRDGGLGLAAEMEAARAARFSPGSGLPLRLPVIDMVEIGAGGGSLARIDTMGLPKVGPDSAGSNPGPACYGLGGHAPTVTDANLVLGYYNPGFFLGGRMVLDREAAQRAIGAVAGSLGLEPEHAAWGIHRVVVENMAAAIRAHVTDRGQDPAASVMIGFGGAGPAHAAQVARALGMAEVIIPPASGAASALGFLATPLSAERVRALLLPLPPEADAAPAEALLAALEAAARAELLDAGVPAEAIRVERSVDLRLAGQLHELTLPLPPGALDVPALASLRNTFIKAYTARYCSVFEEAGLEAVSFRVRCTGPTPDLAVEQALGELDSERGLRLYRRAWFGDDWQEAEVHDRYALACGDVIHGPAIIEERMSTTVVPPGDVATVDAALNLRIAIAPARPAERLTMPGGDEALQRARIEADPVRLEVMRSRLAGLADEMAMMLRRTAFSPVITESGDFSCGILDPAGEPLAHSRQSMPVFHLSLPRAVKAMLERFPPHTLRPGDVLVTNDPWLLAGHLLDIAVVTPVFAGGEVVALLATAGDVAEIGGTQDGMNASEVFEEGLQIPPMKLFEAGRPNDGLFTLLRENVRRPHHVLGDLHAFVAVNRQGGERLLAFMAGQGLSDLRGLAVILQDRAEQAMRAAIRALPDGVQEAALQVGPEGAKLRYPLRLTVAGDEIRLDFTGAPLQRKRGGTNCTLNYTAAHATYPLACMLTPDIPGNGGCFRPIHVLAPEGSLLNARRPAAVAMRTRTGWYLATLVFQAFAGAAPGRVLAHTGMPVTLQAHGEHPDGTGFYGIMMAGGGQGASAQGDGKSGLIWPSAAANTSVEAFEARVPLLVETKAYVPDSGGAGRHRGGLGQRLVLRKLHDDRRPVRVLAHVKEVGNPVAGLKGGAAGRGAACLLRDAAGTIIADWGHRGVVELLDSAQRLEVGIAGGSGYGPPGERPEEAIRRDLRLGMVTQDGAARDYPRG